MDAYDLHTGNGNNLLWKSTGTTKITMGDGNQNITVGQVQDYCGCYGKSISETVTAEDIQKNDDKALDVLAAASTKACASTLTRK